MNIRNAIPYACVIVLLAACGGGLSEGSLAEQIDEYLIEKNELQCWSLERMDGGFPVSVRFGFGSQAPDKTPILRGLAQGGYITFNPDPNPGRAYVIDLTEKGRDAEVWDPKNGFCVGRPRVHEVIRWTEPADDAGVQMTRITYTWKLADGPDWVDPKLFPDIEGMSEPVKSMAIAQKTSDGWRIGFGF
ncbi:MAG: DNA-directed RNA polymerase subunit beta [Gammaproteobacteria bacterium]